MLVLSRKKGESLIIQDKIEITILEVTGDTVKIGINAPKEIEVLRKEIHSMVKETNQEAAALLSDLQAIKERMKKIKESDEKL